MKCVELQRARGSHGGELKKGAGNDAVIRPRPAAGRRRIDGNTKTLRLINQGKNNTDAMSADEFDDLDLNGIDGLDADLDAALQSPYAPTVRDVYVLFIHMIPSLTVGMPCPDPPADGRQRTSSEFKCSYGVPCDKPIASWHAFTCTCRRDTCCCHNLPGHRRRPDTVACATRGHFIDASVTRLGGSLRAARAPAANNGGRTTRRQ